MRPIQRRGFVIRIDIVQFADNDWRYRNPELAGSEFGFMEDALTAIQLPLYRPMGSDNDANRCAACKAGDLICRTKSN
ncbi:MAG: hypothetical protein CMM07_20910 [Rhodopirellula sp.]|nr:hypothetical protein [Rhodopirellula sp.]